MKLFSKQNISFWLFAVSFIVYLFTVAPGLMFTDSGELAAVCVTLGVAHPTGYPLFTILGHIWSLLNFNGSEIYWMNIFAVFTTALSVSFFFNIILLILNTFEINTKPSVHKRKKNKKEKQTITTPESFKLIIATITALAYTFALTIWQQATMLEVYSLQLLMFNLIIYYTIKAWLYEGESNKHWYIAAFFTGISFSNHMTTILLLPALVFLFLYKRNKGLDFSSERFKFLLVLFIPLILGLSLYLYLPLRSATMPEFNWGWVSRSFDKFWYHVSGKQYRVWMFADSSTISVNAGEYFNIFLYQFGWIGIIPLLAGFYYSFKLNKTIFWFLILIVISNLIYSWNYGIHDIETYFSLSFIALLLLLGIGLYSLFLKNQKIVTLALIIPLISVAVNFSETDNSSNNLVPEYTKIMTNNLDNNAIIISAQWDYFCSAFWYMQRVENYRPDIVLVEKELLRRTWYLKQFKRWYPDIAKKSKREMELYDSQLELFEADKTYNPLLIQKYYIDLINSIIDKNIDKHPVYITPDIMQNTNDKDIGAKYFKIPSGFAFKLEKNKPDYIPDLSKIDINTFLDGHYDREDHLVKGILGTASMAITNIGRYAQFNRKNELARKAYYTALKIYPNNQAAMSSLKQIGK